MVTVRVDPIPPIFEQTTYSASVAEFTGEVRNQQLTDRNSVDGVRLLHITQYIIESTGFEYSES